MTDLLSAVDDYCSSETFLFLSPALKPHAESLLADWCRRVIGKVDVDAIDRSLREMASLDLPVDLRKQLPFLLRQFFGYLGTTGRFPEAKSWDEAVAMVEMSYACLFREDGSVRGGTFRKKYTDVGRNDPCPCGSGKKFKKCCMGLIS
jgi:hypothetical protein